MQIYNPFQRFDFDFKNCFLTGKTSENLVQYPIIDPFLQQSGDLSQQLLRMLDERMISYADFTLPCDPDILQQSVAPLQQQVLQALQQGYKAAQLLDANIWFRWAGLLVYGFIYHEMNSVMRMARIEPESAQLPQGLMHKFRNLHLMLQSICLPIVFDGFEPFSLQIFPLDEKVPFSFRDDMNSLTFSMKMNDIGLVITLQDNGYINSFLHQILKKTEGKTLSIIQFEEVCAHFYYASYLMNRLPEYDTMSTPTDIYLDLRPIAGLGNKSVFDVWQNKTYAQVLENFWKKWNISTFEILKNPEEPLSML